MSSAGSRLRTLVFVGLAPLAFRPALVSAVNTPAISRRFRRWRAPLILDRTMKASELNESFEEVLTGLGSGNDTVARQLEAIEVAMQPIFQAMPKNSLGRLSHEAASYVAYRYFTQVYGWNFRGLGLDVHGMVHRVAAAHEATVLQEKAPELVAGLLESRSAGRGFALGDVAAMAATLHKLVVNDVEFILRYAYVASGLDTRDAVEAADVTKLLMSVEIVSQKGFDAPRLAARLQRPSYQVVSFAALGHNVARTLEYQQRDIINPFVPRRYSFSAMAQISQGTFEEYGSWQNDGCKLIKDHLMRLDPMGSGRVPLGTFYAQPESVTYNFSESQAYLRHIGALDESVPGFPRVLITNYIVGAANCYSSSTYYKFCCFNECNSIMSAIEQHVQAPEAGPEGLLLLIGNLSTSSVEAPRQIPAELVEKLHGVAKHHGGKVPLHGRLFAQWLHFAFPMECPYPHVVKADADRAAFAPSELSVGHEEKQSHVEAAKSNGHVAEPSLSQWTDDELLLFQEDVMGKSLRHRAGLLIFGAALVAFLRSIFAQCSSVLHALQKAGCRHGSDLPISLQKGV